MFIHVPWFHGNWKKKLEQPIWGSAFLVGQHDWRLAPAFALEIRFRQLAGKAKDWLEKVEVTLSGMKTLWCWNYVGCHSIFMVWIIITLKKTMSIFYHSWSFITIYHISSSFDSHLSSFILMFVTDGSPGDTILVFSWHLLGSPKKKSPAIRHHWRLESGGFTGHREDVQDLTVSTSVMGLDLKMLG